MYYTITTFPYHVTTAHPKTAVMIKICSILVEMQALWGEPTSDFTRMRRNRMHVCCGLVAEWLSLASLLCSESMLRRCAKSTFETFELQRPMYVRCKPHVPLLNLNRTHAPSEGDGRTIHDNTCAVCIYILVEMQALWGEPTSDFTRMRRNRMHVCCGLVAEWK